MTSKIRVLYAASEIAPFLSTSHVAEYLYEMVPYMQSEGVDVRVLVPRFGIINRRKHKIHEVVRLSGTYIRVGDEEHPLTVKVGTVSIKKAPVYFLDNETYFKRRAHFFDNEGKFFKDNDRRATFFCKGVLETIKKLDWSPNIIHCHDWISSLIPIYLNTLYKNVPIFEGVRTIFTVYNNGFEHHFGPGLRSCLVSDGIPEDSLEHLDKGCCYGILHTGIQHADITTHAEELSSPHLSKLSARDILKNHIESYAHYHEMYHKLSKK